jgi:hypothetical protein
VAFSPKQSKLLHHTLQSTPSARILLSHLSRRPPTQARRTPDQAHRNLWTSALKAAKKFTPEKVTSPLLYSRVVRLEEEANASPNNVAKQVTLWRAIMDIDTSSAYEKIINRWERLIEFVSCHSYNMLKSRSMMKQRLLIVKSSSLMQPFDSI